jgi:hypothetical protein
MMVIHNCFFEITDIKSIDNNWLQYGIPDSHDYIYGIPFCTK